MNPFELLAIMRILLDVPCEVSVHEYHGESILLRWTVSFYEMGITHEPLTYYCGVELKNYHNIDRILKDCGDTMCKIIDQVRGLS